MSIDGKQSESASWRQLMQDFVQKRLEAKLKGLAEDDPKSAVLLEKYQFDNWLADAARRVFKLDGATHIIKAMHGDARGSSLYVEPTSLAKLEQVSSHVLGELFASDVVGDAAVLDVYKFLKLDLNGRTLLQALQEGDADVLAAFSTHIEQAQAWAQAFLSLLRDAGHERSSHVLAKQVYWQVGPNSSNDEHYHLLAPLFPTSLMHRVHATLQEDRFGEENKQARQARRDKVLYDGVLRHYPDLAVRKLGGTKPQNISQLNSERVGVNYLLASLPPQWRVRTQPDPWKLTSIFTDVFSWHTPIRQLLQQLNAFLSSDPPATMPTRDRRDRYIDSIIDEVLQLTVQLRAVWALGWTADSRCQLDRSEQLWLDTGRMTIDSEFQQEWERLAWTDDVAGKFARWLNAYLSKDLPVGDIEHREWKKELLLHMPDLLRREPVSLVEQVSPASLVKEQK